MSIVMMMMIDCEVLMYVDQISNRSCLSVSLSQNCYFPPSWAPQFFTPFHLAFVCKYYHISVEIFVDPFLQILLHIVKKYFWKFLANPATILVEITFNASYDMRKDVIFLLLIMLASVADEDLAATVEEKERELKCCLKLWEVTEPQASKTPLEECSSRHQDHPCLQVRVEIHLLQDCPPEKKTRLSRWNLASQDGCWDGRPEGAKGKYRCWGSWWWSTWWC